MNMRPIEILLIEDEEADVVAFKYSLEHNKIMNKLSVANRAEDAMKILKNEEADNMTALPDLIVLDLNLPGIGGRRFLDFIKKDPKLKRIPIAVMTSSDIEKDILESYEMGANCYIQKPINFDELKKVVLKLEEFGISIVTLPPKN